MVFIADAPLRILFHFQWLFQPIQNPGLLGYVLRAGVQRARAERIFEFAATARDVYVLRASDQLRLQELLYVQKFKIMASKRRATIIL
jgi:hypothetical protein